VPVSPTVMVVFLLGRSAPNTFPVSLPPELPLIFLL